MTHAAAIIIGCDHAAVGLKNDLAAELRSTGAQVEDVGTTGSEPVDYPDVAELVGRRVASGEAERGILLCGTGIGVCIAANKIAGVRAALCHDVTTARLSRRHNDANVLCLGGRTIGPAVALEIVRTWLGTPFEEGRHRRRIEKIEAIEARSRLPRKENTS